MIETLVVLTCVAAIMIPIWQILRSGTRASMKGMLRVETALEGRAVLRQIHIDLRSSCFVFPETNNGHFRLLDQALASNGEYIGSLTMTVRGAFPKTIYSFLAYPTYGDIGESVPLNQNTGVARRRVSRIEYRLQPNPNPRRPWYSLVRDERFAPDHPAYSRHPNGIFSKILSDRVNFFEIRPYCPSGRFGETVFWIHLSLIDVLAGEQPPALPPGGVVSAAPGMVVGDFFDVAGSEYFTSICAKGGIRRNYHLGSVSGPMKPR